MILPLMYSLKDFCRDLIGIAILDYIPQSSVQELEKYYIVDIPGLLVWTAIFLLVGILLGRATK